MGWGLFTGALVYCVLVLIGIAPYVASPAERPMADGAAYYFATTPYDWGDDASWVGAYRYAPTFLDLIAPLRLLPWELFAALWFAAHVAVLVYLRIGWMLILPPVMEDALWGNTSLFIGLIVVVIVSRKAAPLWAALLLTKVTPGVAMAWHAARREWRELAVATMVTGALVAVGVATGPDRWLEWFESLASGPATYDATAYTAPLIPRLVIAGLLAAIAGRLNRAWLLPIAVLVATPGLWPHSFAILVGSFVLWRSARQPLERIVLTPVAMAQPQLAPVLVTAEGGRVEVR
jgi:hypothetical protein